MHTNWLVQVPSSAVRPHLSRTNVVSGVDAYVTDAARLRFPDIQARFLTIHNGADVDALSENLQIGRPPRPDPQFLFVGRLSPEKGVHVLLQAFEALLAEMPDARLTLVGGTSPTPRD